MGKRTLIDEEPQLNPRAIRWKNPPSRSEIKIKALMPMPTNPPVAEFDERYETVTEEAYRKGAIDQGHLIFFALSFIVVFLAFSKVKRLEPFSKILYVPTATDVFNSLKNMTTQMGFPTF